jgi:diadenosine tetraphosphate (Ap4A) HIT family hydrolase
MCCPFCDRNQIENRIFYENSNWIAFLAAPYHTRGHSIIVAKKKGNECPRVKDLGWHIIHSFDSALADVAESLMKYYNYKPKDILFTSVRGDVAHFHCHLIPLWDDEEKAWRRQQRYDDRGHLLEYLGFLERSGNKRAVFERVMNGWTEPEQRKEITKTLKPYVEELRELTGYRHYLSFNQ